MNEKSLSSDYCLYYHAKLEKHLCWFVTSALRSYEHVVFWRTIDVETSTLEFFVPQSTEKYFLEIMHYFQEQHLVTDLVLLPNRLLFTDEI
jgi:hypothetical protein